MTRMVLVRHGVTDWNRQHRIQGRSDVPLNEEGRRQARATGAALAFQTWDAVYTSPLSRALETAEIIAEAIGAPPPVAVFDLIERDYGEAEGCTRDELDRRFPEGIAVVGRESRPDVVQRAVAAFADIEREHPDGRVLVVSHGGFIRSVLMHAEPEAGAHHTEPIANGSAHSLDYASGEVTLVRFAEELVVPADEDFTEQNAVEAREEQATQSRR